MPAKQKRILTSLYLIVTLFASPVVYSLNLDPISADHWDENHVAHLASRAGFGLLPGEIAALAAEEPTKAVAYFVDGAAKPNVSAFEHSGIFDEGLDPFPPSRPATTRLAKEQGHALGINVKPGGNRPIQPIVNKFFYWLRASRLETDRVSYWWANRMLTTNHPLQEKMALFWHGHFATNEDKVRDYRKMLKQLELFQEKGLSNFRELLIAVSQDPAMLAFLDAGVNTKDSPNENFAREIMELFTMGVGHYSETDVQEAARAFTGWNSQNLVFYIDEEQHDSGVKRFLGKEDNFSGTDIIDLILEQPVTAEFIAAKIYRYFVSDQLSESDVKELGALLRDQDFDISEFMSTLFLSEDFYSDKNRGTHIKSPVELVISTYKKLGINRVPGIPDFNVVTGSLGQRLMHPPTVAGWSEGRSWITPSLLFERGNFVLDSLFPDIGFVPPDRYPVFTPEVVNVQDRLRQGMSITMATKPSGVDQEAGMMSDSNMMADRDEAFNTRLGSMRGWQMAIQRVKPIERSTFGGSLTDMVLSAEAETPEEVIAFFHGLFFEVSLEQEVLDQLVDFLEQEIGGSDLRSSDGFLEEPLRKLLHSMLSLPEYQLG